MARKSVSTEDNVSGKIKRAAGELIGRPDLVLEGEAQDTGRPPESAQARSVREKEKPSPPKHQLNGIADDLQNMRRNG